MFSTVTKAFFLAACLLSLTANATTTAKVPAPAPAPASKTPASKTPAPKPAEPEPEVVAAAPKPAPVTYTWKGLGFDQAGTTVVPIPGYSLTKPGALEFYYRGIDNNLYGRYATLSKKTTKSDSWEDSQNFGGPIYCNPAGVRHPKGTTIITIGQNTNVRSKHRNEGDVFADWINHGSNMFGNPAASYIHGYVHMWTRHVNNYIYYLTRDINGNWSGFNQLNLIAVSSPASVGFQTDGGQTRGITFALGEDNTLKSLTWDGNAWQAAVSAGGKFVGDPVAIATKPSMGLNAYTACEVYARTSTGLLMRRKYVNNDLGPWETMKFPMYGDFSAIYISTNSTTLFFSNVNGGVASLMLKDE